MPELGRWSTVVGCCKMTVTLSILHLYIQILPGPIFHRVCYILAALSWCYFVMVFVETFAFCRPISYNWDKSIEGTCHHQKLVYLLAAVTNLVRDVIVATLPMPLLWRLHMSNVKKLGISAMFSLGAMSVSLILRYSQYQTSITNWANCLRICIISVVRVIYTGNLDSKDIFYSSADLLIWSVLESTLGVVNASLPVLKPVFQQLAESHPRTWFFHPKPKNPGFLQNDCRPIVGLDARSKRDPQSRTDHFETENQSFSAGSVGNLSNETERSASLHPKEDDKSGTTELRSLCPRSWNAHPIALPPWWNWLWFWGFPSMRMIAELDPDLNLLFSWRAVQRTQCATLISIARANFAGALVQPKLHFYVLFMKFYSICEHIISKIRVNDIDTDLNLSVHYPIEATDVEMTPFRDREKGEPLAKRTEWVTSGRARTLKTDLGVGSRP